MKRLFIIAIAIFSFCFEGEAQLLEDNQSRLKTTKVKSKGFLFFRDKKKVKTTSGAHKQNYTFSAPRYSKGVAKFRTKGITPRYSGGSPFKGQQYRVYPRYSAGSPFKGSRYKIIPRYSAGSPFKGSRYKIIPRYSPGNPFKARDYKITPRYSRGNPFRGQDYRVSPRYSAGSPFRGRDYKVTPRYSKGNPFRGKDFRVSPRYSQGSPFRAKDFRVTPRYSQGNPFRGIQWVVKPRYSDPKHRFDVPSRRLKRQIRYQNETYFYKGDWKVTKRGGGDQHPSSNYRFAQRFSNPKIRKMFRKWNIFWVRLNRNKEDSKGVRASVRSPKFDKKEKDIWNN